MNKLKHIFAALLLVLPLAFTGLTGMPSAKAASNETAYIRLHKLVFGSNQTLPVLPGSNDLLGKELSGDQLQGGKSLNGVEFTVYDVTNSYQHLSGTSAERQKSIQDNAVKAAAGGYAFDSSTTKGEGTADFALPVKSTHEVGKNAVYLIRETKLTNQEINGNQSVKTADPIVLVMPLNQASTKDDPLHIYPKNQTKKTLTKDLNDLDKLDKIIDKKHSNITDVVLGYGDKVSYTVSIVVPADITSLDKFEVIDTPDAGLDIDTSSISIHGEQSDKTVPDWFLGPTADHSKFTIRFTPSSLADYAGKVILITYNATVNKKLVPGKPINNHIALNNQPQVNGTTPITTGGAKFKKTDADTGNGLKGAEFLVTSKDGKKYLTDTGTGYEWKELPANFDAESYDPATLEKTAVVLTSEANGQFEITGLGFGDYSLTEVKAPEGHALLTEPQTFKVDKDSYVDDSRVVKIANAAEGVLPHTGGMGIYVIILIGAIIIAAGIFFLKRSKRHEEI